jgi:hypothetical protein
MDIIKVTETIIYKGLRRIKSTFSGDTHDSVQISPFGDDSCPTEGVKGIKMATSTDAYHVILGYFNRSNIAAEGEKRLYSLSPDGSISFYVHLKNNGTMELGGTDDNIVRYSELKSGFDELKGDFNNFLTNEYNIHTHPIPGVTPGSGSTTSSVTTSLGTSSEADISGCKIDEIKTI